MELIRRILPLLFLLKLSFLIGQEKVPENVFLHLPTTNVLTGELIHFSAFSYHDRTGKLMDISSLLYIELVDENGESRLQSKVELISGRGQGEMFIPIDIETGIYRLTAYTRWMKNTGRYFNQPVVVINPYRSHASKGELDSVEIMPTRVANTFSLDSLPKFKKLSVNNYEVSIEEASNLSIAVSRLNQLYFGNQFLQADTLDFHGPMGSLLMPEYQYGIIQGSTKSPNTWITASLQGDELELDAVQTDSEGDFAVIYNQANLTSGRVRLKVEKESSSEIQVFPEFYDSYPPIRTNLVLEEADLDETEQRSIYSQLMNAYVDQSMTLDNALENFIPVDETRTYKLDEYKRFKTMRETFIELIFEVAASKNEQNTELQVRSEFIDDELKERQPLLLLDGIQVESDLILSISPYLVEEIEILSKGYFIGGYSFNGIISVHTFKKDLGGQEIDGLRKVKSLSVGRTKKGIQVEIEKQRHPHFEQLLYFDANLAHAGGTLNIEFMTSNNTGLYQLSIKGVTTEGRKVSRTHHFVVE
ncbi:MAG: hypothetical protein HRT61_13135 [Ekhidna sp.]|nr:hypothetical protein [Ekhidna sp.]